MGFSASPKILRSKWKMIPSDTDILVTHSPPLGIMDTAHKKTYLNQQECAICGFTHRRYRHWGDEALRTEIINRIQPKVSLFGHVHQCPGYEEHFGVVFINSAMQQHRIPHDF